jgi:hypothetical protein
MDQPSVSRVRRKASDGVQNAVRKVMTRQQLKFAVKQENAPEKVAPTVVHCESDSDSDDGRGFFIESTSSNKIQGWCK